MVEKLTHVPCKHKDIYIYVLYVYCMEELDCTVVEMLRSGDYTKLDIRM